MHQWPCICVDILPTWCFVYFAAVGILFKLATHYHSWCFISDLPYPHIDENGHSYKSFQESLTFLAARQKCLDDGADLVSITSEDEENYIRS